MKYCPAALQADLAAGQMTAASLWLLALTDGTFVGIADHDQDITFQYAGSPAPPLLTSDSVTYLASSGFSRYNINQKSDASAGTMQLDGAIDAVITRDDIIAGRYNYAKFQVLLINWAAPDHGVMIEMTGSFGPFTINEFGWSVELRGLSYLLTRPGGDICQPSCRVDFGSQGPGMCNFDVTPFMQSGTVTDISGNNKNLTASGIADLGKPFDNGLITFLTGNLADTSYEVKHVDFTDPDNPIIQLKLAPPLPIADGDTFKLQPSCDHTKAGQFGCFFWSNVVNYQGEPDVPGEDNDLLYPDYQEPHG